MSGNHEFFRFESRMEPHIDAIYRRIVPGYVGNWRYKATRGAHPLDQHYGIDGYVRAGGGMMWTVQEKCRQFDPRRAHMGQPQYRDYTLEFMNCPVSQKRGEHFHLAAQWYFYGWANKDETAFDAWFFMNVPLFAAMCAEFGGAVSLSRALHGENKQNKPENSRASFLTFPAVKLRSCFYHSENVIPFEVEVADENAQIDAALSPAVLRDEVSGDFIDEGLGGESDYEARANPWDDDDFEEGYRA